jgi:hypothetical protein
MRISEAQLRTIIKQELTRVLNENNTPAADEYFKKVLEYLRAKGNKAPKADFSYTPEEAKQKNMTPIPPYSTDDSLRRNLFYAQQRLNNELEGFHVHTFYLDGSGNLVRPNDQANRQKQIDIVRLSNDMISFYERPVKK